MPSLSELIEEFKDVDPDPSNWRYKEFDEDNNYEFDEKTIKGYYDRS